MVHRSSHSGRFWPETLHFKIISLFMVWLMVFTSLPSYGGPSNAEWTTDWSSISARILESARQAILKTVAEHALKAGHMHARPLATAVPPMQAGAVAVFVGFADSSSPSANFPTPWQGSSNTIFIGNGAPVDAGAIRIDNSSGAPLTIDSVSVDLQRSNAQFNLWGSFTIPANGSAILTQTQPGNFDTSAFPIVACGGTLDTNETRVPTITVTSAGTPQTFVDTAHTLDTGGFDLSCRGNESLQWRQVGTAGIDHPAGHLALQPANSLASGGSPVTASAVLTDATGAPLPNVTVNFNILSGPNAGQSGQDITDTQGNAHFTYTSAVQGADIIQASVQNASTATLLSSQAVVNWQTASCAGGGAQNNAASLIYIGATVGEFNDNAELAALLTDSTGAPASGRALTFSANGQNFAATTDATGVGRVDITLSSAPGPLPVAVNFAGDTTVPPLQASSTITIDREETRVRYTGNTLVRTGLPQPVTALLVDPGSLAPIANKTVTFQVGPTTATAITDANGVATANITLTSAQVGPSSMVVDFAGDGFFKPSLQTIALTIYSPAAFVVWGGNSGGLKIGQRVNFWGSQWESQVINGQYFAANPSFKGWSGSAAASLQCQANVTPSTLTPACWQVKPGQSFPPSGTLPDFIEVIISTAIDKSGDTVFGNIACGAVVKIDRTPPYGAVPGQPGFGTIVGVNGSCGGVFPQPAVVTATQTQPASVLPNQQITIQATVSNASTATTATGISVSEVLDDLTPGTVSLNLGNAAAGGNTSASFQATVPAIPIRQGSETTTDYIQRLTSLNGRIFTAAGQVNFSDSNQQTYLPVDVSSQSVLRIPIVTLALTGPAVVSPGANSSYLFTATNIGSAVAAQVQVNLTLPDGSNQALTVSGLAPGSSFTQPVSFTVAAIAPKGANESTSDYLARLAAADGALLTATATANWTDANGNTYGDVGQEMFSSAQRVPVLNLTGQAPPTLLPSQNATLNFSVQNTGGCTAAAANLQVANPDNTQTNTPTFPVAAGQTATTQTAWHVTAVAGKQGSETDSAYLARLNAVNNSALNFHTSLSWSDPAGSTYGPTSGSVASKEILPIVVVALGAPSTVQAGNTLAYLVTLTNTGSAAAPAVNLTVTLPDGSAQTPTVGSLAPGATFQATINFAVPTTQAAGTISAQAVVFWNDAGGNGYGSLSAIAQTVVTNPQQFNSLVLAPAIAGPDVTGTTQTLTATLKDSSANPIANASVTFTVTGVNTTTGSAVTNVSGIATFAYSGTHNGNDTVQATSGTAVSNNATVSWVTPVQNISTSTIFGRFFASDGSGGFDTPTTATPAFTQSFPTINFNPPAGTIPGNTSGIGVNTRPFTDVTTDLNGNFTGTIVAQGNGVQAGVNTLFTFDAVFTSTFTVASAGDVVLSFFSDDGFILGVGGGATRVSGPLVNVPPSGLTPFESLPVMGAFNNATAPIANTIVIHFPAAGSYPYELDYTECCGGQEALTMAVGQANSKGVPPTGSLTLNPNNPPTLPAGQTQTFTVQASDASGLPVPNAGVALIINGANQQQLSATTGSNGRATFSYSAVNAGTDSLQAVANIGGLGAFSNLVNVTWTVPAGGGGTGGTITFVQQGWIGGPLIGTVVQGQLPITVAPGITLTSGTLEYWPTSNPNDVHVINGNTTGSGTIGTFDATTLANGGYTIQLQATASTGTQQTSVIVVSVTGENKPGRVTATMVDLKLPVAGIPITVSRTYDSLNRSQVGDFGFGWALGTTVNLTVDAANNVSFTVDGKRSTFFFSPQSISFLFPWLLVPKYVPQPGLHGTLTSDGCDGLLLVQNGVTCFPGGDYQPTTYTYTDAIGRVLTISSTGQVKSIQDLRGNVITFGPNGITSNAGNLTIPFVRDGQNRITQITDLDGNSYSYTYDGSGNLSAVTLPGLASSASYTYSSDHLLLTETDPRGNASSSTYFPDGRLKSITDPLGNITQYSYNATNNSVSTTAPDGGVTVTVNNTFGKPVTITDALNRTTSFTYDANQNVLTETNGLGKITRYTYDANGFKTSTTDPLGNVSRRTYNQFGGTTSTTDALSNTQTITYDVSFNPTQVSDSLGQIRSSTYDAQGDQLTVTDANGKTASFTYDAQGTLISRSDPLNRTTTYTYDAMNRLVRETDPRQQSTSYTYDGLGHVISTTNALNQTNSAEYDGNGNKTATIDALGRRTSYLYDALNHLLKTTYPDSTKRQYTYDFRGNVLTETDQAGHVTQNQYDKAGQLLSTTYAVGTPDAATLHYSYDAAGQKTTFTDERGNVTTYGYDNAGHMTSVHDALGNTIIYGYDADGRQNSVTDPLGHITRFAFDARGRVTTITNPDNTTQTFTYDGIGHKLTQTDEAGHTVTKVFDDSGRVTKTTDAAGQSAQYAYDLDSNLISLTDAAGRSISYQYDSLNRRISRTLALGMSETYGYDAAGNLVSLQDFNGSTTTFSYDPLNRMLGKTPQASLNQPGVSYSYTATGKRASMLDGSGSTFYTYDNRDRLVTKAAPAGTLSYTYNAAGKIASIQSSNPSGTSVAYAYDAANRLSTVTDRSLTLGVTSYQYDAAGNRTLTAYPNGVRSQYVYDTLNRLTSLPVSGAVTLASFSYTREPAGHVASTSASGGRTSTYTYDSAYKLVQEVITGAAAPTDNGTLSYTYDLVGNQLARSSSLGALAASNYSYDANDRLTTNSYDANGNILAALGSAFGYNFENQLTSANGVVMTYDGDGNRVAKTVNGITTRYLVDDLNPTGLPQVVDETVNGAVVLTYTYGSQRISQNLVGSPITASFYGYDGHGNVRLLTNAAGTVTDKFEFDAFGNLVARTGGTITSYLYSGEQFDGDIGLYYLRARWYDPNTGRFMTRDPNEGMQCRPLSFNPYIYTEDDPVNATDPTGKQELAEEAIDYRPLLILLAATVVLASGRHISVPEDVGDKIKCEFELVACLLTSLADEDGSVFGSSRCLECQEACIRLGYWPSRAPRTRGSVRCDYWNFPSQDN